MKKLKKAFIVSNVLILVFIGNFVYGYYIGYNAKYLNYYNRAVSPDNRYAIEIQVMILIKCFTLSGQMTVHY